jgi:hypothetical protein
MCFSSLSDTSSLEYTHHIHLSHYPLGLEPVWSQSVPARTVLNAGNGQLLSLLVDNLVTTRLTGFA